MREGGIKTTHSQYFTNRQNVGSDPGPDSVCLTNSQVLLVLCLLFEKQGPRVSCSGNW